MNEDMKRIEEARKRAADRREADRRVEEAQAEANRQKRQDRVAA